MNNIITYDKHVSPIIFGAYGAPDSGRETTMVFLAEVLWDARRLNLKPFEFVDETDGIKFTKFYQNFTRVPYGAKDMDLPIIMIPKIPNAHVLKFLRNYPNLILLKVTRTQFKEGSHPTIGKVWEEPEDDKWIYTENTNGTLVYPISNNDTMRVLKFQIRNMFENEIMKSKIWRDYYGIKGDNK